MTFRVACQEAVVGGLFMGSFAGALAGSTTFWVFVWHYFGKATGWW